MVMKGRPDRVDRVGEPVVEEWKIQIQLRWRRLEWVGSFFFQGQIAPTVGKLESGSSSTKRGVVLEIFRYSYGW